MTHSKTAICFIGALLLGVFGCSGSTSGTGDNAALGGTSATGNASSATTGGNAQSTPTAEGSTSIGGSYTTSTSGSPTAMGGTATIGGSASGGNSGSLSTGGKVTGGSVSTTANTTGNHGGNATGSNATGGTATGGTSNDTGAGSAIVLPIANAAFDYQIGGAYTPPSGVSVVSRDRNSAPAVGLYNICYVNGFQIQPDEESFWTGQHPKLVLREASGDPVVDEDWGEMLLDTSTAAKRTELATIIGGWIAQCKLDGFDAVEIDNLDSYSRSSGLLTQANNVEFMALLSDAAHGNGLAIAQKNSSELLGSVASMGTDFAVVEECNRYDECDTYQAAYGNRIYVIEYRSQDYQTGCSSYPELSIVLRDLNVSTPSSSAYVYQGC